MPKRISIAKSGITYLAKSIVEILGRKPCYEENTYALVMYNDKLDIADVQRSVELILEHIKHKRSIEERTKREGNPILTVVRGEDQNERETEADEKMDYSEEEVSKEVHI